MRRAAPLAFLVLTAADAPAPVPDVNEAGRVLATLNDWRAIIFVLVFLLFLQLLERLLDGRNARLERREMAALARSFAASADKVGDGLGSVKAELLVLRALTSRVESGND